MDNSTGSRIGRRSFLKLAASGVALGAAGSSAIVHFTRTSPASRPARLTRQITGREKHWHLVATDGWAAMPDPSIAAPVGVYYPDMLAPEGQTTYIFGFVDVTDIAGFTALPNLNGIGHPAVPADDTAPWDRSQYVAPIDFKTFAQISAPLLYCDDGDDLRITLENLGLGVRPDLFDPHTIHWHGFANQIPYFDGVPDASLSVPSGSELTYRYLPTDVGTYMYHCHVEDVEHVHMGLTGMVFIRPSEASPQWSAYNAANFGNELVPGTKYAYYHNKTDYDREYAIILTELNVENHWNDAHIQESDWSEYRSTFGLMNGRSYPDTVLLNGPFFDRYPSGNEDILTGVWRDSQLSADDTARLAHQPNSALIQANAGERVLLRISNLGFDEHSMVLPGINLEIVGRDAKLLYSGRADYLPGSGRDGDVTSNTYRIDIGPGESRDIILVAPDTSATGTGHDTYPFYDRSLLFREQGRGFNATTTSGSTTLTTAASPGFDASDVGKHIAGAGIPPGTTIAAFGSSSSVTLSAAATASGTDIVTIMSDPSGDANDAYGAMRTEVHIYAAGTLGDQTHPNQLFDV